MIAVVVVVVVDPCWCGCCRSYSRCQRIIHHSMVLIVLVLAATVPAVVVGWLVTNGRQKGHFVKVGLSLLGIPLASVAIVVVGLVVVLVIRPLEPHARDASRQEWFATQKQGMIVCSLVGTWWWEIYNISLLRELIDCRKKVKGRNTIGVFVPWVMRLKS